MKNNPTPQQLFPHQQKAIKDLRKKLGLEIKADTRKPMDFSNIEKRVMAYFCSTIINSAHTFGPRQCRYKAVKDGLCTKHYNRKEKVKEDGLLNDNTL